MSSEPNTLLNALIGAVVTVLLSFTLLSPVAGGAVAGYLQRGDGVRVGAISGLIATLPVFVFGALAALFFGIFALGASVFALVVLVISLPFVLAYVVGLSALGGYLGVYLAGEL